MKAIQGYLDKMGGNFLVAGLIPSLAFVMIIGNVFKPILPDGISIEFEGDLTPTNNWGIIFILVTIVLGFTLSSLSTFVIKIFEGYILLEHFPFLRNAELSRERKLRRKIKYLEGEIERLKKKGKKYEDQRRLRADQLVSLMTQLSVSFPPNKDEILPTPFGNTLRAAEAYTSARYRIDAVPMWTRMIHVIPDSYNAKIDSSYNQLCFLVNCSLLTLLLSLSSFSASLYLFLFILSNRVNFHLLIDLFRPRTSTENLIDFLFLYFLGGILSALFSIVFYRASLISVAEFGSMIRSSYDLFRFDLLKQLRLKLPDDSEEELDRWQHVSRFFNIGRVLPGVPRLVYVHEAHENPSVRPSGPDHPVQQATPDPE